MNDFSRDHPHFISITAPENGERWSVGSKHYITWRSSPDVTAVKVEYSLDGGQSWIAPVAAGTSTSTSELSSFLWQVPSHPQYRCKIRTIVPGNLSLKAEAEISLAPSQEVSEYRWTPVTLEAEFAPRDGAGALVFKDRMWLLGGWNPGAKTYFPRICNSEVWSSTNGLNWRLENQQAPWEGRHTAGYVVHAGRMWIVGGDANQGHYQNDVWSSGDGVHWELVRDSVPWGNRVLHYTLVHDGKIWVMGGQSLPQKAAAPEVFYNDVWNSEDGANWTLVTRHAPWSPRGMIGGNAVSQGRMWILGGGTYDTPATPTRKFYNDVWSSEDGVKWERHVEFAPWPPRQYHEVATFDNRLWVLEGFYKKNRNDVYYSLDGSNWYELPDTPWAPRHAASVFVYEEALWVVAGNNMFSDVWKLTRR